MSKYNTDRIELATDRAFSFVKNNRNALAGGAIGAIAGGALARATDPNSKRIAQIKAKGNLTPNDLAEIKRLKGQRRTRVAVGAGGGALAGGAIGHASKVMSKPSTKNKKPLSPHDQIQKNMDETFAKRSKKMDKYSKKVDKGLASGDDEKVSRNLDKMSKPNERKIDLNTGKHVPRTREEKDQRKKDKAIKKAKGKSTPLADAKKKRDAEDAEKHKKNGTSSDPQADNFMLYL